MPLCSQCQQEFSREFFSAKQMEKGSTKRCKVCVESSSPGQSAAHYRDPNANNAPTNDAESNAVRCHQCKQMKPRDEFEVKPRWRSGGKAPVRLTCTSCKVAWRAFGMGTGPEFRAEGHVLQEIASANEDPPDCFDLIKDGEAEILNQRGNAAFEQQNLIEAVRCYQSAIAIEPTSAPKYYGNAAQAELSRCRYHSAANFARKALELSKTLNQGRYPCQAEAPRMQLPTVQVMKWAFRRAMALTCAHQYTESLQALNEPEINAGMLNPNLDFEMLRSFFELRHECERMLFTTMGVVNMLPPQPKFPKKIAEKKPQGRSSINSTNRKDDEEDDNVVVMWWRQFEQNRPKAYLWFCDAVCLRAEDIYTVSGELIAAYQDGVNGHQLDGRYAMRHFKMFMRLCGKKKVLPPWWNGSDALKVARKRVHFALEKSDIVESWDVFTPMTMRALAELAWDRSVGQWSNVDHAASDDEDPDPHVTDPNTKALLEAAGVTKTTEAAAASSATSTNGHNENEQGRADELETKVRTSPNFATVEKIWKHVTSAEFLNAKCPPPDVFGLPPRLVLCSSCLLCCRGHPEFRCARCKRVAYCCKECQQKHWPEHKSSCEAPVEIKRTFSVGSRKEERTQASAFYSDFIHCIDDTEEALFGILGYTGSSVEGKLALSNAHCNLLPLFLWRFLCEDRVREEVEVFSDRENHGFDSSSGGEGSQPCRVTLLEIARYATHVFLLSRSSQCDKLTPTKRLAVRSTAANMDRRLEELDQYWASPKFHLPFDVCLQAALSGNPPALNDFLRDHAFFAASCPSMGALLWRLMCGATTLFALFPREVEWMRGGEDDEENKASLERNFFGRCCIFIPALLEKSAYGALQTEYKGLDCLDILHQPFMSATVAFHEFAMSSFVETPKDRALALVQERTNMWARFKQAVTQLIVPAEVLAVWARKWDEWTRQISDAATAGF